MRNRSAILRRVALGASTVVLAGMLAALAGGTAAFAATGMTFSPETGTNLTQITVTTVGFCPAGNTNDDVTVSGSGITNHPIIAANSALPAAGPTGYTLQLSETMSTFASEQSPPATLSGAYVYSFNCFATSTSLSPDQSFTGTLTFTSATTYTDGATSTTLAASKTGSQPYPTVETLTATVAPAGTTGTVQFVDGTTNIGSPVTVTAAGTAVLALDGAAGDPAIPVVGSHSYTAVFTPVPATQNGVTLTSSTSTAQTLTVTTTAPTATLTGSAPSITTAQTEILTCTVAPGVAGTVTFYSGTTAQNSSPDPVGAAPNNVATYSSQYAANTYSFTCKFTPTDTTDYSPSTSTAFAVSVTAVTTAPATETIQVTVANGSLTITTAPSSPVVLTTPVLNSTGNALVATGALNTVTVSDTACRQPRLHGDRPADR